MLKVCIVCNTALAVIPAPEACTSNLSTSIMYLAVCSWVGTLGFHDIFYPFHSKYCGGEWQRADTCI